MAKSHRENVDSDLEERQSWSFAPVPDGINIRVLNEDDENGALTALLDIPKGWEWSWTGYNKGHQEFFVVEGVFEMCGHRMTNGCYSFYPPGSLQQNWRAETDCTIYALFDSEPGFVEAASGINKAMEAPIPFINTWTMEWFDPLKVTQPDIPFPPGAFIKSLRIHPETKASTYVAGLMPGWVCERVEKHPVGEEEFTLAGDLFLGEVAGGYVLKKGGYFCRPPGVRHGPLVSKNGVVIICHPTGILDIEYDTNPNADRLIKDYFETVAWV